MNFIDFIRTFFLTVTETVTVLVPPFEKIRKTRETNIFNIHKFSQFFIIIFNDKVSHYFKFRNHQNNQKTNYCLIYTKLIL